MTARIPVKWIAMKLLSRVIYTYNNKWWFGGFTDVGMLRKAWKDYLGELWWIVWEGEWWFSWHWPMVFGIGRDWYDGPIWHAHLGLFSIGIVPAYVGSSRKWLTLFI